MGRTGDLNYDFYDLERIEVIRGPQGVLLGKNVVGGALSVITAKPSFEPSGNVLVSLRQLQLDPRVRTRQRRAQRLVGGTRSRSRAASTTATREDILHNRDVEDLESYPGARAAAVRSATARHCAAASRSTTTTTRPTASTRSPSQAARPRARPPICARTARARGATCARISASPIRARTSRRACSSRAKPRIQQFMERDGFGACSISRVRGDGLHVQLADRLSRTAKASSCTTRPARVRKRSAGNVAAGRVHRVHQRTVRHAAGDIEQRPVPVRAAGRRGRAGQAVQPGVPPHLERPGQPLRLDRRACTCKSDDIDKTDRFIGENFLGTVLPGGNNPLSTLSGENRWVNDGKIENYAGFAQIGFKFTDTLEAQRRRALHATTRRKATSAASWSRPAIASARTIRGRT